MRLNFIDQYIIVNKKTEAFDKKDKSVTKQLYSEKDLSLDIFLHLAGILDQNF